MVSVKGSLMDMLSHQTQTLSSVTTGSSSTRTEDFESWRRWSTRCRQRSCRYRGYALTAEYAATIRTSTAHPPRPRPRPRRTGVPVLRVSTEPVIDTVPWHPLPPILRKAQGPAAHLTSDDLSERRCPKRAHASYTSTKTTSRKRVFRTCLLLTHARSVKMSRIGL